MQYGLKTIDDIDLIDILSPSLNGKILPHSLDRNVRPVVEKCRNAKTLTDAPAGTQNQPSQSASSTQILLEYQTQLATHKSGDARLDARFTPTFDDGSTSYRSLEDRPQLCQWLNETANSNLTVTERLERSNWEPDGSKTSSIPAVVSHLRELSNLVSM